MTTPLAAPTELDNAVLTPEEITRRAGSNFGVSFLFLGREQRRSMTAVYAFCRVIDDAVDDAVEGEVAGAGNVEARRERLRFWERELELAYAPDLDPRTHVGRAIRRAAREFGVRQEHLAEIVRGMGMDLAPVDFATVQDLEDYCFKVASAVGLSCLPILGADPDRDREYARHLGMALQITNILRDLPADAESGRVYAPRDLRRQAGIPEADAVSWLAGRGPAEVYRPGGPVAKLVEAMADLADSHFAGSAKAMPRPHVPGVVVAEVMAAVYRDLLARVRRRGANLRAPRPRVSTLRKIYLALRTRLRGRR